MSNKSKHKKILLLISALAVLILNRDCFGQAFNWTSVGTTSSGFGTNGNVRAIIKFNSNYYVGGRFTQAGIQPVNNIAGFDAAGNWFPVSGLADSVNSLTIFNSELCAASGNAVWHLQGSNWVRFGSVPFNGEIRAVIVLRGSLIAAGLFTSANTNVNHIAQWDGSVWMPLGTLNNGTNDDVYALTLDPDDPAGEVLYVGGKFTSAGGQSTVHIAKWDVAQWLPVGTGMNAGGWVHSLTYHHADSLLIAGGNFTTAGGVPANHIASWKQSTASWNPIGSGTDTTVFSLSFYNNQLVAGGSFRYAGGHYVDRIALWDGSDWSRMITGMNNQVNCLFTDVAASKLFAGGQFTTAAGKLISHIGLWSLQPTVTISGRVTYSDNGQPVPSGSKVRAVRPDVYTREIILIDSTGTDVNGNYTLTRVRQDTNTDIITFPDDEFDNLIRTFVPTYHDSTIDWQNALSVIPNINLTNINISVSRVTPGPENPMTANIGGHVYLRYNPPFDNFQPLFPDLVDSGLPYKSGSIVYAKQGNYFRGYGISNGFQEYSVLSMAPGDYNMYAYRLGYTHAQRNVTLGNVSLDTIDFYLDTISLIGIHHISTEIPEGFALHQNYPNPFNAASKFKIEIVKSINVKVTVYDILGREVVILVDEYLEPGAYEVYWNALNVPSGVYFYRMQAGEFFETKKMVLIK